MLIIHEITYDTVNVTAPMPPNGCMMT